MSTNMSNSAVAVRTSATINNDKENIFQTLQGDTLSIIGTAHKGKAFVPQNIVTIDNSTVYNNVLNLVGSDRQNRFRHLNDYYDNLIESQSYDALSMWLQNKNQASFIRVLGIGNGTQTNEGNYLNSGFNASSSISRGSVDNITKSGNRQAINSDIPGNVSFILSKRIGRLTNYISDLGLDPAQENYFIDTVLICPDKVLPSFTTGNSDITEGAASYAGQNKSYSEGGRNYFVEFLGLNSDENSRNKVRIMQTRNLQKISAYNPARIASHENYWPDRLFERGHFIYSKFASCDMIGLPIHDESSSTKIITTRNYSDLNNANLPDFNSFENKYQTAKTPWVTSQSLNREESNSSRENIHNEVIDLFRFYSLDDGEVGNRFRIKINPLTRGKISDNPEENLYATFEIYIFEYSARVNTFTLVDSYDEVNLDPDSAYFIGRLLGDENTYYDIENKKVVTEIKYEKRNQYLRVEIAEDVLEKKILPTTIPSGFRAYPHIRLNKDCFPDYADIDFDKVYHMPLHYSPNYFLSKKVHEGLSIDNNWGVIFSIVYRTGLANISQAGTNSTTNKNFVSPHYFYTKYFLNNLKTEAKNIWVEDDTYLNSFFHLEKIYQNSPAENWNLPENLYYSRKGDEVVNRTYLDLNNDAFWDDDNTLVQSLENKLSFDFFTYGGFDGVDIRDKDKRFLNNNALQRESNNEDSNILSLKDNPTYRSYFEAIDVLKNEMLNSDILCMPGISNVNLSNEIISFCEDKKNKLYVSDISSFYNLVLEEYFKISNDVSNYFLDKEVDVLNNITINDITENALGYSLTQKFDNIINLYEKLGSKYFVPMVGNLIGYSNSSGSDYKKVLDPSLFAISAFSSNSFGNIASIKETPGLFYYNSIETLIKRTNYNLKSWDEDVKRSRNKQINLLYNPSSSEGYVSLLSQYTSFDNISSSFSIIDTIRSLNIVKKIIKLNLFTQPAPNSTQPILFNQNSDLLEVYRKLETQLNSVLSDLVSIGVISGFKVFIPNILNDQMILDMQNYIIRGTIFLVFNSQSNENIINLQLDDILNDISILTHQTGIELVS